MAFEVRDKEGKLYDLYGKKTVYEGPPLLRGRRYLVWHGTETSKTSKDSFATARQAIKCAVRYQEKGYHVKVTDRLIEEREG